MTTNINLYTVSACTSDVADTSGFEIGLTSNMAYLQLVRRRVLAQLAQTRGWQRGHRSVGSSRNIGACLGCGGGSSSSNSNVGRRAGFATHAVPSPETATEPVQVPSHARVVIVGGGVIGSSTAYHLRCRGN